MLRISIKDIQSLEAPHKKPQLSTRIGRLVERASYTDMLLITALALSLTATYFFAGFQDHTLSKGGDSYDAGYFEALYFCIVTFTSLGYGDLAPVGFGRAVASALVLWGLATIALVIGKIASERSQTSLMLLHRSDVERRLSGFAEVFVTKRRNSLELTKASDVGGLERLARALVDSHQSSNRYIIFHANQSTALAYGNDGALSAFAKELVNVQECCISLHKEANQLKSLELAQLTRTLAYRLHWTVNFLGKKYDEAASMTSWSEAIAIRCFGKQPEERRFSKTSRRVVTRMQFNLDALDKWRSTELTVDTLAEVYVLMPDGPMETWPRHVHKDIAEKIGESNNRVSRHIDRLIEVSELPKK